MARDRGSARGVGPHELVGAVLDVGPEALGFDRRQAEGGAHVCLPLDPAQIPPGRAVGIALSVAQGLGTAEGGSGAGTASVRG